jgi:hemerythrin-like domain-containing protein
MPNLHVRVLADHRRLDELLATCVECARTAGPDGCGDAIGAFQDALLTHLDGEEKHLFPLLSREFPDEVVALREEHVQMRRQLDSLIREGWDPAVAARLDSMLRRHAQREDSMLFDLVNDSAASARYRDLIAYLEETFVQLRALEPES